MHRKVIFAYAFMHKTKEAAREGERIMFILGAAKGKEKYLVPAKFLSKRLDLCGTFIV